MKNIIISTAFLMGFASPAFGQTTAGVFGPNISPGDRTIQLRTAVSPAENGGDARWESRVHYQQALSDTLRARIVLQGSNFESGSFESNFAQAELQWQFKKADPGSTGGSSWASAFRLDLRLVEGDDGEDRVGFNWTNQWNPNGNWQFNNVVLLGKEIGSDARDGVFLEIRNGIKYKISQDVRLGLESFSAFGRTGSLGNFNTQNHRLGPVVTGKIGEDTSFLVGALFGASRAARDVDFRVWLTRKFQ